VRYPGALRRLVERGITLLEPWWIPDAADQRVRMKGLADRYPGRQLVPFARRQDRDDVACFAPSEPGRVVIIHDFATDAWERRIVLDDFYAWLRRAVEDMIEYDTLEDAAENAAPK
jgi:hypothetical protein